MIKFHSPEERNNLLQNSSPPLVFFSALRSFCKKTPPKRRNLHIFQLSEARRKNEEWNKERNEGIFAHRGIMTGKKNLDASKPRNVRMFQRKSFNKNVKPRSLSKLLNFYVDRLEWIIDYRQNGMK